MKQNKWLALAIGGAFLGASLFVASCKSEQNQTAQNTEVDVFVSGFVPPDQSTPEKTLRTFWWAMKKGKNTIAYVDKEKLAEGYHGRKIEEFINEYKDINTNKFRFIVSETRVSIQAPNHCMDYDMEKREDGKWVIISIHP